MMSRGFFPGSRLLMATVCLLVAGLWATPVLKGAPVYTSSDTFLTKASNDLYPRMFGGFAESISFDWRENPSVDTVQDSRGSLQGAILITLLVGSFLRFLISDTVRQFIRDTFDPMNWNQYQ